MISELRHVARVILQHILFADKRLFAEAVAAEEGISTCLFIKCYMISKARESAAANGYEDYWNDCNLQTVERTRLSICIRGAVEKSMTSHMDTKCPKNASTRRHSLHIAN